MSATEVADPKMEALAALVENRGNVAKTSREIGMSESSLRRLRGEHEDTYHQMETVWARVVENEILQRARANAREAGEVVEMAIGKARELVDTSRIGAAELARIARDMSQVHSQNVDKVLTLTGRPAVITESRELVALVESLEADGVLKVKQPKADAESTAEEMAPGETSE